MSTQNHSIAATAFIAALERSGVDHFVTVPDWIQWALHARIGAGVDGIREVICANEDQAVTTAAGLTIGGKRPVIAVQNQGLYACVNTIRAVALDARIPTVFLVGQFGREFSNFGANPAESRRNMVRLLEPVLDALAGSVETFRRWGITQGQGALVGATLGELPVPQAIAAMTSGETDPAEAAEEATVTVTELQDSLR